MLLRFGGVWVDVKILFLLSCVSLILRLGMCGWMFKLVCFEWCVERLLASWETSLGRRVSDCIVAFKVWGCVG